MSSRQTTEQRYRIGAVSRLTGVNPDTLRMWERRYGVVEPVRAPGGGREYSGDDVARLQLIKRLVDGGDAIGSIAGLDTGILFSRYRQAFGSAAAGRAPRKPCRIIVAGEALAARVQAEAGALKGVELLAAGPTLDDCLSGRPHRTADVLVIEIATVHVDTSRQIVGWLETAGARRALVVYRFSTAEALQRLPAARIQTVRAPVSPVVVRNLCLGMRPLAAAAEAEHDRADLSLSVSARRYSNEVLAKLAQVSSTIQCECPRHLAELISGLVAFERYSSECEIRNLQDAALHAYLHATASHARYLIEDALAHLIEVEGIEPEV
jgi:hypothetical protein